MKTPIQLTVTCGLADKELIFSKNVMLDTQKYLLLAAVAFVLKTKASFKCG